MKRTCGSYFNFLGAVPSSSSFGISADWAWQVWLWQLQRMTGAGPGAAGEMIHAFGRSQGTKRRLRGWLYVVRRTGWLHSARYWPKWLLLFVSGLTPRYAIYLAAYRFQETRHGKESSGAMPGMEAIGDLLPVDGAVQAGNAAEVARQLVWNYKEFVMETRA